MKKLFYLSSCFFMTSVFLLTSQAAQDIAIPPVVVSASKGPHESLTNSPKTIITQEEIAATGVNSLPQALQELGGIQLQDETGTSSQVLLSMRGFGSNANSNTLMLVNGIPITNPDLALPDLNSIPLQEIEYIEIISGSESVLYGDQAVGGTINIVTRQQTKEHGQVSCVTGSYHQRTCYGIGNHHFKQWDVGMGLTNNHTDNYREHNQYDQTLLSGNLEYPYQTGRMAFNYHITHERMQYPGALTAAQVIQNRRQAANDTDFFKDWNGFYHLKWQQQFSSSWQLETDLFRREMHGNGVLTAPFTQSRVIHFFKPEIKGTLGDVIMRSGLDLEKDEYHLASVFGTTQDSQQKYGIFSLVRVPVFRRIFLSFGARAAEQKNTLQSFSLINSLNRAVATTFGVTFEYDPSIKFYLRRAENFRFPKADENASTAIGVNGLKTQRGVSYEAGTTWTRNHSVSQLSIYQLNLKDEIAFDPTQTPLQPFGVNKNLDPTVRRGLSLAENYQVTERISLGGQYNYVNARFSGGIYSGNRIPLVAENIMHLGMNIKLLSHWNLYTEAIFTGNEYPDSDDANVAGKMGAYTLYNFNLRYVYHSFTASFRVNNVFNKYYYFYTVYVPMTESEFFYPAPGRSFLLTLKYAFV